MSQYGCLFIVPTPIGNLSDISSRALEVLQTVDLIAAEDTRHSFRLLSHYQITSRCISMHAHNEHQRTGLLIERLMEGKSIALISDAGTPLISDPGYELVNTCRAQGLQVIGLPGPCALTTALCASGLPTDTFTFFGFLPVKQQAKTEQLLKAANCGHTCVFYEAPRRIRATLDLCQQSLPVETHYVLAKELTKTFETYISGDIQRLLDYLDADPGHVKGEFVLMLHCKTQQSTEIPQSALNLLQDLLPLMPPKQAAATVAKHYSVNKKQLYELTVNMK